MTLSVKTCVAVLLAGVAAQAALAAESALTVLHAGKVLAVPGKAAISEASVLIKDGKVVSVEKGYTTPEGAEVIDLKDKFVMPGLMDMHVHLQGQRSTDGPATTLTYSSEDLGMRSAMFARRTLMAGFTTVRDLGAASPQQIYALKRAVDRGWVVGPRIIASAGTSPTGSHADVDGIRHELLDVFTSKTICDGPYECRAAVREGVKYGANVIKITATGGVLSDTDTGIGQQMRDDELNEIVKTAHSLGRRVAAHAHAAEGINAALRAGVDSIEHGSYADAETIKLMKEKGAYFVPTLLAGATVVEVAKNGGFTSPDITAKALRVGSDMAEHFATAFKAGVNVAYGTDSGVSDHGDNAKEGPLMVAAGMKPMEVLVAATVSAAKLADMSDTLGTLEAGKFADIVAFEGDPTQDINAMLSASFVMKGGKVVKLNGQPQG